MPNQDCKLREFLDFQNKTTEVEKLRLLVAVCVRRWVMCIGQVRLVLANELLIELRDYPLDGISCSGMTLVQIQGNWFNGSGGQSQLTAIVCEGATALEKCRLPPEERADTP